MYSKYFTSPSILMSNIETDNKYCEYYDSCGGCEFANTPICNKTCSLLRLFKMRQHLENIEERVDHLSYE
jgi:hypothetical protein